MVLRLQASALNMALPYFCCVFQVDRGNFLRDAPRDLDAVEGDKAWSHDMYSQIARPAPRRPAQQRASAPAASAADGTKL